MIILLLAAIVTIVCYACLVAGAKADENSERQYREYMSQRPGRCGENRVEMTYPTKGNDSDQAQNRL